ncbi:hypothetical protein TNCV_1246571 [Trichonephila clavipes]|uniref:Uncharacterized protein n=1 Tax=Trichonephila clavipes TaxID=2585209 RepID=A0A8X6RL13_TRICX|nr:hypothetical protein TNCV_1246571 [Trichonephila clavipes]
MLDCHLSVDFAAWSDFRVSTNFSKKFLRDLRGSSLLSYGSSVPLLASICKEQLPAPGNRSNERRYREKDLATTEEKKVGTGDKERVAKKAGVVKSRHG